MSERDIFTAAREMTDPVARSAYLDGACGGDTGLRSRVEALLRAHVQPDSLLDHPVVAPHDPDNGATQALTGTPDPGVAVAQTTGGENGASDDEALSFLFPSQRPDSLGRLGHYEVLQVLGRGGFGIVFRAFDDMLQRVVAVKVMAPQIATLSPARKRFLREARSSAAVRHENVVHVYEVGEQPLPYLVMEFIPGETLQRKLDRCGPLDVPEVLRIGRQIAEGLAAAHACDLIHRDIKPGNVLLEGGTHKAKITDFGLARAAADASISQSGIVAGTPMFMAPEQALGHKIDQRADLFSLGSVLYQMVSGRPPFRAPSALAVLKRVAEEPPRPITEIIPETPDWLCGIIVKLHAKNPDDRFQSAREVADLLADCEGKLKAKQQVKNVFPAGKPAAPTASGGRKWVAAAAVLLLPVIALVVTEFAGVTHLFRQQATLDPNKRGGDPTLIQVAKHEPPPLAVAPFNAAKAKERQEAWAKHLGVDVEFTNSIGMKLRVIPPGQFLMGSPDNEVDREAHEGPQHEVVITQPFGMGVHDVTVGQFKAFVKETGYRTEAETDGGAQRRFPDGSWKNDPQINWHNPGCEQTDEHSVMCVSWNDAKAFCDWLSAKEGKPYALPTEAQWEYACRAGSQTKFTFGADDLELDQFAWYYPNAKQMAHPVGQKKPNAWGLYDMHGNVWQWTADCYAADYYQKSPKKDPPGCGTGDQRVMRGGGCWSGAKDCRAAHRQGPIYVRARSVHFGFRVVQVGDLKAKAPPIAVGPFTDADVQRIAALPAAEQVEEVRKELKRRNPGFDGKMEHKIEDGVVTELKIVTDQVTDIAPIRVWSALRVLQCSGTHRNWWDGNGQLADLTPLKGMILDHLTHLDLSWTKVGDTGLAYLNGCMSLTHLDLAGTKVSDVGLAYLKECKRLVSLRLDRTDVGDAGMAYFMGCKDLKALQLVATKVSDAGLANFKDCKGLEVLNTPFTQVSDAGMAHFKDCKYLKQVYLHETKVGDAGLANFKGMPLTVLYIMSTPITDLTPLQGMPLKDIRLTPKNITRGLDILRDMKSLKTIGINFGQAWPAAEFWERYDKGEFKE